MGTTCHQGQALPGDSLEVLLWLDAGLINWCCIWAISVQKMCGHENLKNFIETAYICSFFVCRSRDGRCPKCGYWSQGLRSRPFWSLWLPRLWHWWFCRRCNARNYIEHHRTIMYNDTIYLENQKHQFFWSLWEKMQRSVFWSNIVFTNFTCDNSKNGQIKRTLQSYP